MENVRERESDRSEREREEKLKRKRNPNGEIVKSLEIAMIKPVG